MIKLGNRGDTIVEVMISLAVLSFIISISYATATRSLKQSRQSQERVEAVKVLESQIEKIRALSTTSSFAPTGNFCITASNAPEEVNDTPDNCKFNGLYDVSATLDDNLYTVNVTWASLTGGETPDKAIMYYRVY